jgi:integrase
VEIDGKSVRKRRMFSTEQKAYDFATDHERDVADHGIRFGSITTEARRAFDFYRDARAEEIDLPSFETLVMDAVASFRQAHADRQRQRMTVAEAVAVFLSYKGSRVGKRYLDALKGELGAFAKVFGTDHLDKLTTAQIDGWICGITTLGPATRNKLRQSIAALFTYGSAKAQGWCDHNPLADIEREKIVTKEPEAYTPENVTKIMQAALVTNSPALPSLALGFFAGLRPSETWQVDLGSIDLSKDEFRVPGNTKTGARVAPLTPACKAWLAAQTRRTGKAWLGSTKGHAPAARAVLDAAKVTPIFDGARHSFISYRTAATRDVARVSDECGNSPGVIKKHYRQLVTAEAAVKYFAIRPEAPAENVTDITEGMVA